MVSPLSDIVIHIKSRKKMHSCGFSHLDIKIPQETFHLRHGYFNKWKRISFPAYYGRMNDLFLN
jgi:glutaredoxin-related protein